LETKNPAKGKELKIKEFDLCDSICPGASVKAIEILDSLSDGEKIRIIIADKETLKTIVRESKIRALKLDFKARKDDRFILSISK
jgi:TusA-related sulfurtransferase